MLTADKIAKLRELAERGVDGEKENAKNILTRAGIPWQKPKKTVVEKIKTSLGKEQIKKYSIDIKLASDLVLLQCLKDIYCKNLKKLSWISVGTVQIECTRWEMTEISERFNKEREAVSARVTAIITDYLKVDI